MPKDKHPWDDILAKCILDPRTPGLNTGPRGSSLEDGERGRAAPGRPRAASRKRAALNKQIYGPRNQRLTIFRLSDGSTMVLCDEHSFPIRERLTPEATAPTARDVCRVCTIGHTLTQ